MTTDVAVPEDDTMLGLGDIDESELVVPRIKIIGADAQFEDTLTNERFDSLNVILLGLVKERILWDANEAESAAPMCKSNDAAVGIPADDFPWAASSFDKAAFGDEPRLPCDSCPLKEWGSHPKDGKKPWCSEQHTYPLLVVGDNGSLSPALFSVQRSAIKGSKAYVSGFIRARTPLFTAYTKLSLTPQKSGSVKYATPVFAKGAATDIEDYPDFAQQYRSMRTFIQTVRKRDDDGPTAAAAPQQAGPAAAPAAASTALSDDDAIPF